MELMKEWVDRPEMGLLTAVVKSKDFMPTYFTVDWNISGNCPYYFDDDYHCATFVLENNLIAIFHSVKQNLDFELLLKTRSVVLFYEI